jgi:acetylornithine/succinyldiaminopimelate/putrescine aminotransferase
MTLAKGLGGGVPIGAFLCKNSCDVLRPGDHGSTYGGNPLMCAASYAAAKCVIEEELSNNARIMGERLEIGLEAVKSKHETVVKETRGLGLLIAVELHEPISSDLVSNCNEEGLLLNPVRPNTIRFMPPLNVTSSEIDEAISKFEKGLIALSNS